MNDKQAKNLAMKSPEKCNKSSLKITRKLWVIVLFFSFDRILDQFFSVLPYCWPRFESISLQSYLSVDSSLTRFRLFLPHFLFCLNFVSVFILSRNCFDSVLTQLWLSFDTNVKETDVNNNVKNWSRNCHKTAKSPEKCSLKMTWKL